MAVKSASAVAEKWVRNLGAAGQTIREGVQSVTESPGEAAIRQKDNYIAGVQRAFSDGSYERGLRSFSLDDWKRAMVDKGLSRVAAGATAAKGKVQDFLQAWLPYQDELQRRIAQMPKSSIQDSIARAQFAIEFNSAFKR